MSLSSERQECPECSEMEYECLYDNDYDVCTCLVCGFQEIAERTIKTCKLTLEELNQIRKELELSPLERLHTKQNHKINENAERDRKE